MTNPAVCSKAQGRAEAVQGAGGQPEHFGYPAAELAPAGQEAETRRRGHGHPRAHSLEKRHSAHAFTFLSAMETIACRISMPRGMGDFSRRILPAEGFFPRSLAKSGGIL